MSLLHPSAKVRRIVWIVLAVLIALELIGYYWMNSRISAYRNDQPLLNVIDFTVEEDQVTVTVENPSARQYRGTPAVYVLDAPDVKGGYQMYIHPKSYYDAINRSGSENYDGYAVIPPQKSVTLYDSLSEEDRQKWEKLCSSAETLYACVPPSYAQDDANLNFYHILLS